MRHPNTYSLFSSLFHGQLRRAYFPGLLFTVCS
jgi:hypothetical protein